MPTAVHLAPGAQHLTFSVEVGPEHDVWHDTGWGLQPHARIAQQGPPVNKKGLKDHAACLEVWELLRPRLDSVAGNAVRGTSPLMPSTRCAH